MKGPMEGVPTVDDDIFTNPYKPVEDTVEKKKRNLEKRKIKLQQYDEDERNGKKLTEEQIEARSRIGEVETQLEFVKDIMKTLNFLRKEFNRASKLREEAIRKTQVENDRKRLAEFMTFQSILKTLTKKQVKKAFTNGTHGAIMLCNEEHALLENLVDCFTPTTDACKSLAEFEEKCDDRSQRAYAVIAATKEKVFEKSTGANVRALMERIVSSKYVQEMKVNSIPSKKDREEAKTVGIAEPEVELELPKSDPKVIFVRSECAASVPSVEGETMGATSTEFGFEGYVAQGELAIRDPPPPIPLPSETREKEPAPVINGIGYGVDGSNTDVMWTANNDGEAKAETATSGEKRLETVDVVQGSEQSTANAGRAERKPRCHRVGVRSRNAVAKGEGNDLQWQGRENEHQKQSREGDRPRPPRDSERQRTRDGENPAQPRDPDRPRAAREERFPREVREAHNGQVRPPFRGGRGGFLRGTNGGGFAGHSAPRGGAQRSYPSSANGYANGYGNPGYAAYSYANANPPRQAGFNFAPGPLRAAGDSRK